MIRRFKALGLLLAAVCAFAGWAAVTSSAEHFTSEVAHTTLKGSQTVKNKFHIEGVEGGVECNRAEFEGTTTTTTTTEITIHPHYTECTAFGNPQTYTTTGCNYIFTTGTTPPTSTGSMHIECEAGKQIEIHFNFLGSACTLTIHGPQTPTEPMVTYETGGNAGATHDLLLTWQVKGITYTRHGGGFCVFIQHEGNNMTLTGSVTIKGFDTAGNQVGITAT